MSTVFAARTPTARIGALELEHGGTLEDVQIAFETYGSIDAPAVLVLGGISAGRHLLPTASDPRSGWWPGVAGDGCALDPRSHCLVAVDWLGGRGESSRPDAAAPWPVISTYDQAAALVALLDTLDIEQLHAVVGASYGGMVALALAERHPERVARVIALCAAHRSHPMATAVRSVQRRIIRLAQDAGEAPAGVAAARALAVTTYRTPAEFNDRFSGQARITGPDARFPIDSYLDHHGRGYAASFPAASYITLSQSLDAHRVDPRRIRSACTLVCFDSDTLVPLADVHALASSIPGRASVACIPSRYGHDGFLKETHAVGSVISAALADCALPHTSAAGAPPARGPDGEPVTHYAARTPDVRARSVTAAVRAGIGSDAQHGAVIPPIHLSTTFTFDESGSKRQYDYTRSGNPTRDVLASAIAELEHGAAGLITATGMAAITVALQLLKPGDRLIAAHDGYGGTYRLIRALAAKHAFAVELVDLSAPGADALIRARAPRMVWVETPSNPLLRITDISRIAAAAHDAGAICVVDNTFLSPALQTPIDHGADIVVHSTTKYINGHSDVVGGALVARDAGLAEELGWWANCIGATGSPFDSYLTLRGLRTLHVRIRSHEENAAAVVDLLNGHPAVTAVHYPGLSTHPGHDIARGQQRGFGAMVSFEIDGGEAAVRRLVSRIRHFSLAESLGGVESLIAHPATMTHAAMDPAARAHAGIGDGLLRLSVGIEAQEDLLADLACGLEGV